MPAYPEELHVERHSNGVVVATLNRPEVLNAFNGALRIGIKELVTEVKQDSSVRALVLTGAGKAFCSGADLRAEDSRPWPRGPADPEFSWCVELLEMPKPTIAAVNGVITCGCGISAIPAVGACPCVMANGRPVGKFKHNEVSGHGGCSHLWIGRHLKLFHALCPVFEQKIQFIRQSPVRFCAWPDNTLPLEHMLVSRCVGSAGKGG